MAEKRQPKWFLKKYEPDDTLHDSVSEGLIPPLDVVHSSWVDRTNMLIDYDSRIDLSVRAKNVLRGRLNVRTYGDLFALTFHDVKIARNSGVKTWKEIDKFRSRSFVEVGESISKTTDDITARWGHCLDEEIEPSMFPELSKCACTVLFRKLMVSSIGGLLAIDSKRLKEVKCFGREVTKEILDVRRHVAESSPRQWLTEARSKAKVMNSRLSATSYGSLPEMLMASVAGAWKMDSKRKTIMDFYMGLLNSNSVHTLAKTGDMLHITRERVRQIAKRISCLLFKEPLPLAVSEMISYTKSMFEAADGHELSKDRLVEGVNSAFGWTGTTAFSICRILEEAGVKVVELPEGECLGLNNDGRFDWVAGYRPSTLTERRHAAIKRFFKKREQVPSLGRKS